METDAQTKHIHEQVMTPLDFPVNSMPNISTIMSPWTMLSN